MSRLAYYASKLKRAYRDKTLSKKVRTKIFSTVYVPSYVTGKYFGLSQADRRLDVRSGFRDHRGQAYAIGIGTDTVERLIRAYAAAKRDQSDAPEALAIKGLWEEWISVNYGPLIAALDAGDGGRVAGLLDNFDREGFAVGTGVSHLDWLHVRHGFLGGVYARAVWAQYRDVALYGGVDLAAISHPVIGNPAGILLNGAPFPVEAWRHVFNAHEAADLLRDVAGSVVAEIGGGFGSQAYQIVRAAAPRSYILYDIPEVAVVSGAFLVTALPDKKVALYGENGADADVIVHPHFAIPNLADDSVDFLFNSNSFSEMDAASSSYYLETVNRCCRRYFRHINHEGRLTFSGPDGTSVNRIGSEMIPDLDRFKRLFKRPRLFNRPEDKTFPSNSYLYERVRV